MIRGWSHPDTGALSGSIRSCGIRLSCRDGITQTAHGHLAKADHAAAPDRLTSTISSNVS